MAGKLPYSGVDRNDVEYVQDYAEHGSPFLSRRDSSHGRYERNRSEAKVFGVWQQSEIGLAGVSKWPGTRNKSWQRRTFPYRLCGGIRALLSAQISEPGSRTIPTADGQNKPARFAPGDPIGMPSMSGLRDSARKTQSISRIAVLEFPFVQPTAEPVPGDDTEISTVVPADPP